MNFIKKISYILGWLLIALGIPLGIYIGCYLMFFKGIIDIISGIEIMNAICIATGICKIVFCEIAVLVPIFTGLLGVILLDWSERT